MPQGFLAKVRMMFEGDPAIRRVSDDPVLSAELVLLFRMILADGEVDADEMETFRHICSESFGIPPESLEAVIRYLQDFAYETTGSRALELFRGLDHARRVELARHMVRIAKSDHRLNPMEISLLKRTMSVLEIDASEIVHA